MQELVWMMINRGRDLLTPLAPDSDQADDSGVESDAS